MMTTSISTKNSRWATAWLTYPPTCTCPYCGEPVEITLDPGSGSQQDYVEGLSGVLSALARVRVLPERRNGRRQRERGR